MTENDVELLHRYAREGSEECFTELVRRHVDLVYSAALRQVRAPELAEEVAQSVFIELSRSATRLRPESIVTAWLYEVTRRRAIDVVRRESRRQLREQIAWETNDMNATTSDWKQIEPLLDEAMETLDEKDRTAILLRYFENKSLREVGAALGTNEDAAQKRVSRAVERLREFFGKKKVGVGAAGLAAVISANAVEAAPAGLSATISATAALTGTAAHIATTIGVTKAIAMTMIQKTVIAVTITAALGTGVYEARRASQLGDQVAALQQQQEETREQNAEASRSLDDAMKKLGALQSENEQLRSLMASLKSASQELAQIKAEDAAEAKDPMQSAMGAWLDRVDRLKQRLAQMPNASIPEMQYLSNEDWLNATRNDLSTDEDYRRAMSGLRSAAESEFIGKLQPVLGQYMKVSKQFPTDISQLASYFNPPLDPAILQRYEVAPASTVPNVSMGGDWIITQKAAVDDDYDNRYVIGPSGYGASGGPDAFGPSPAVVLGPVMKAYAAANGGGEPTDPSELTPYATTPEEQAVLQKVIRQKAAEK